MQPQNQNPGSQPVQPQPSAAPPVDPLQPVSPVAPPIASQIAEAIQAPPPDPVTPPPAPTDNVQSQPLEDSEAYDDEEGYDDEDAVFDDNEEEYVEPVDLTEPINWQATEFIHQEKSGSWYILFGVVFVLMMAAAFLMKSITFGVLLVVIAGVIIILAKRPPRIMDYSLSEKGLHIGDTLHSFSDFRAFGIIHDGEEYSIMLVPTKRFMPGITVYFPEEMGEKIVDALGSRMPMQNSHLDAVDKIVRKLRLG